MSQFQRENLVVLSPDYHRRLQEDMRSLSLSLSRYMYIYIYDNSNT